MLGKKEGRRGSFFSSVMILALFSSLNLRYSKSKKMSELTGVWVNQTHSTYGQSTGSVKISGSKQNISNLLIKNIQQRDGSKNGSKFFAKFSFS